MKNNQLPRYLAVVLGPAPSPPLLLGPPPDADHVVAGHGHHVLVVKTAGNLGQKSFFLIEFYNN